MRWDPRWSFRLVFIFSSTLNNIIIIISISHLFCLFFYFINIISSFSHLVATLLLLLLLFYCSNKGHKLANDLLIYQLPSGDNSCKCKMHERERGRKTFSLFHVSDYSMGIWFHRHQSIEPVNRQSRLIWRGNITQLIDSGELVVGCNFTRSSSFNTGKSKRAAAEEDLNVKPSSSTTNKWIATGGENHYCATINWWVKGKRKSSQLNQTRPSIQLL